MGLFRWRRWLRQWAGVWGVRKPRPRLMRRWRPHLEALEDRLAPARTLMWTGQAFLGTLWSAQDVADPATNWVNTSVSPQQFAIPQAGDDLVFPAGAMNLANTDDISGLSVRSITFQAAGYSISATSGTTLTVTGSISDQASGSPNLNVLGLPLALPNTTSVSVTNSAEQMEVSGQISGKGGVTKSGAGELSYRGGSGNTLTGTTEIDQGFFLVQEGNGVVGPLVVGPANGSTAARVELGINGATASTVPVTVNSSGELDVGDGGSAVGDTIGPLTLNAGTINVTATASTPTQQSTLSLGGDVTTNAASATATIEGAGFVSLGATTRTFTVAASTAATPPSSDLFVSVAFSDGPSGSKLVKAGAGRMVLAGEEGAGHGTDLTAGTLNVQNDNGLGPGDDINASVTVESGATLEIQAPGATPLTVRNGIILNGNGVNGAGALRNVGGANVLDSNFFVLATDSSIGVDAGSLDLENQIGGTGGLTKVGTGPLTLDNPTFTTAGNTYGGTTQVDAGTLNLGKATAVPGALVIGPADGSTPANVAINVAGATANGVSVTVNSSSELFVSGNDTIGALTLNGGTIDLLAPGAPPQPAVLTLGGDVTASATSLASVIGGPGLLSLGGATRTFTVPTASAITGLIVSATVEDGGSSAGLTKAGAGSMSLSATNTYTGTTQVNAGLLMLRAPSAVVGPLVVGDAVAVAQIASNDATDPGVAVTVNATGELDVGGADVSVQDTVGSLTLNGGTVNILGPQLNGLIPASVLILGGGVTTTASATTANIEGGGTLALATGATGSATTTFTVADGAADPDLIVSALVSDDLSGDHHDELVMAGAGRMVLSGSNTYSGGTDITAGELNIQNSAALGTGASTVETGAAVELQSTSADAHLDVLNALTLNGTGVNGAGALDNVRGNNILEGAATLAGDSAVGVDATDDDLALEDQVSGPGGLTKVGPGILTLHDPTSGAAVNTYGGATQVDRGLLILAKSEAVPGALTVGTGTGGPATVQALLAADAATDPTTAVTVNSDGLLAVGEDGSDQQLSLQRGVRSSDTIGSLTFNGGTVSISGPQQIIDPSTGQPTTLATSLLALGGDVAANASAATAFIGGSGILALGGATRTFTVTDGAADPDLVVSATVADGGASAGLTKEGTGRMSLANVNSYTGTTQVNAGTLTLAEHLAVHGPLVVGDAAAVAQIAADGATDAAVPVTVNATGELDVGAPGAPVMDTIASLALNGGTVLIAGGSAGNPAPSSLVLGGDVTANASAAAATIGGAGFLSLGGATRTFTVADGAADPDLVVSAGITDDITRRPQDGLVKAGPGRMVVDAVNAYGGGTDVTAGELNVRNSSALGSGSATVEAGAALELQGTADIHINLANALTLHGSGVNGAGALDNVSGTNSADGDVTLASDSAVGVDVATDILTLDGQVTGPGGLTKVGPGTVTLMSSPSARAANDYGGATQVDQGLLDLEKAGAVPGALTIGTGSAATTAQVLVGVDAATSVTTAVTVNSDGLFAVGEDGSDAALNGFHVASNDTIASLALHGGTVDVAGSQSFLTPDGTVTLPASVLTLAGDVTTTSSAQTATILGGRGDGTLSLGGASRTFTVAGGGADPALAVSATIDDGGAGIGLTKAGTGRMELDATASYTGTTQVSAGTLTLAAVSAVIGPLVVGDAAALAQITVDNATGADVPVTVNATGELDVGAPGAPVTDTIGSLTLNGGTVLIAGSSAGNPALSTLALGGDVTANTSAVTATIQGGGTLSLGGANRTFTVAGGSANPALTVSASIADGIPVSSPVGPGGTMSGSLTLTAAGTAAGFQLSTFADSFPTGSVPSGSVGPVGIAFPAGGKVLVSDFPGNLRVFSTDTDGQHASAVPPSASYGIDRATGIAQSNGALYLAEKLANELIEVNADGTFKQNIVSLPQPLGVVANPLNGHLFVSTQNGPVFDVDPIARTATQFVTPPAPDGLTIAPDGSILYVAATQAGGGGHVQGYRVSDGALVFDSGDIGGQPGSLDGTALGAGSLDGNIFANTNDGRILEINLTTQAMTLVASGGSRGDFVSVDPTNNTLLLTQSDKIARLIAPPGAGFAGGSPAELTKAGAGRMVVSGGSTYSGGTHITAGELIVQSNPALGSGSATVDAGAALELQQPSAAPLTLPNPLTLNGSGVGGTGAVRNVSGLNALTGSITLASDAAIGVDAGGLNVQAQVTGPGGLTKVGAGTLSLGNPPSGTTANTYGGTTQVDAGLLILAKAEAVPGALTVGTGTGTAAQALLTVNAATDPMKTAVTVNSDGLFAVGEDGSDPAPASNFAGAHSTDTIASLTLMGGTVSIAGPQQSGQIPASFLNLGGDVTSLACTTTATIKGGGTLTLGGANRTFNVADGSPDPDLVVSATIADGTAVSSVSPGGTSSGGLTLTAAGMAAGFTFSTFATGFPVRGDGLGPLSVVFPDSGGVLVDDDQSGNVSRFPTDTDGQDVNSVPATASFGFNQISGITKLGNKLYAATANGNSVAQLNDDGTFNHTVVAVTNADGISADPLSGHLFVSAFDGPIFDVDPIAGTATVFANVFADGLSFDATTNTLYATGYNGAFDGHIVGFNATTGAMVFDSGFISGRPDGNAVGTGALAGNLFVNTNGGTLVEINLTTHAQTLIASGGSRGDFVSVDPTNGTLFVTQTSSVARLIPPSGGGFLGGNPSGLTKAGPGRMVLGATNSYTGTTQVNEGVLTLAAPSAVIGPLVVSAVAEIAVDNATAPSVPVTVNAASELDVGVSARVSTANPVQDTIASLTLNDGTVTIAPSAGVPASLSTLFLGGDVTANPVNAAAGANSILGPGILSLGNAPRTFDVTGGTALGEDGALFVSAQIDGTAAATLTKSGPGPMVLGAANTYLGATVVANGVLALENTQALGATSAGTTVNSGATLAVANVTTPIMEPLTLNGSGFPDALGVNLAGFTGALLSTKVSGTADANAWGGPIILNTDSVIAAAAGGELFAPLVVTGSIGGPGALTKVGAAPLTLANPSSGTTPDNYGGATNVNQGPLVLAKAQAVPHALVVGTGTGTASQALLTADAATDPTTAVTVNSDGLLAVGEDGSDTALQNFQGSRSSDTIASLTLTGGTVSIAGPQSGGTVAASVLTLGGDVTSNASSAIAIIRGAGTLSLGGATRGFHVADGSADPDLTVSATVTGGAGDGLTKDGPGRMVLAATNSYPGTTQVNGGTLTLAAPSAVIGPLVVGDAAGDTPARAQITADNATVPTMPVTVNSSGELGVGTSGVASNQDTIGPLTLNGGAVFIAGAQGGTGASTLTLNGDVTAPAGTSLIGGGGTLSLGNAPRSFTVAAGADVNVDTPVDGTAAATLTKDGPGTLALQVDSTYHGLTVVANGVLDVESTSALGDPAAGTSVNSGATLAVVSGPTSSGVTNIPEPLTLNGPGFGGMAALVSTFLGSLVANSWAGPITLNADSAVETDDALFVSGVISGPGGLTKEGPTALLLLGHTANSYAGPTAVHAGTLTLGKDAGVIAVPHDLMIGDGALVFVSSDEQIAGSARVTIASSGALTIANFRTQTIGSLAGAGTVEIGKIGGTLAVGADNSSTTYGGTFAALPFGTSINLVKVGSGTLTLTGNSPFNGTTSVSGGKLQVDGSLAASPVVVNGGATLSGTGTVGPTTVNPGGTVAPGDSPGILSVQGGVTFNPGSVLFILVNGPAAGSGYSQLSVSGPVALNGPALRLSFGFSPSPGLDFVFIAHSGPVSGSFAGMPEDALLAHGTNFFDLSYAARGVDAVSLTRGDLFVRGLFADFDAPSTRAFRAPFEGRVDGGEARLSVARQFLVSPARRIGEVNAFYATFGQPPDKLQASFVAELIRGVPPGQVLIDFLTAKPFTRRHKSNNSFLRAVFAGLLGTAANRRTRIGHHSFGFYLGELNAGTITRARLVRQLLATDEVYEAAIRQNFETFLGTVPSAAELQNLAAQLLAGRMNPDSLSASIVSQEAYVDFFIARAVAGRASGVVLVNV